MTYELRCAYTEVYIVLENMPKEYVNKIPKKIIDLLKESKIENYEINIDKKKIIDRTKLSKQALTIIAMLNYRYWCPNKNVKERLYKNYAKNEEKLKRELQEKYNPDNLFPNKKQEKVEIVDLPVVIEEEGLFKKVINFIKDFLNKIKRK